jgi:hypothetical protein
MLSEIAYNIYTPNFYLSETELIAMFVQIEEERIMFK